MELKRKYFTNAVSIMVGLSLLNCAGIAEANAADYDTYYDPSYSSQRKPGWQVINGAYYYFGNDGQPVPGWVWFDDNSCSRFDNEGRLLESLEYKGGGWRYANASEELPNIINGWKLIDNKWYYFNHNLALGGWQKIGGTYYYFDKWSQMTTGWQQVHGTWYYMDASGRMTTGWQHVNSEWYYLASDGAMQNGWLQLDNSWYYLKSNGVMATGWTKVGNTWYYMNASGRMQTGWQEVNNTWYYLKPDGAMITGWNKVGDTWFYHNSSGAMKTGWNKVDNTWYYHNKSGAMLTGWQNIDKKWYYFDDSGAMAARKWVDNYYLKADGSMATSEWIGSYYVGADGVWDKNKKKEDESTKEDDHRNEVVGDTYYGADGQSVVFSGKHVGAYKGTVDSGRNCNGAAEYAVIIDFKSYDAATKTYTLDIACPLHFHGNNDSQQSSTEGDELYTFSNLKVSQHTLLYGGDLWDGRMYNQSLTRVQEVTVSCYDFNAEDGTVGIRINSAPGKIITDIYSVKLA